MPELRCTIMLEVDGEPISVSPLIHTMSVTQEALAEWTQTADNDGGTSFHQLQGTVSATLQAILATGDAAFNLKFNASSYLPIAANGLVLILGANIAAAVATNCQINVPGAANANMTALTGGT